MTPHANWTNQETQALLAVWSEEKIQFGLGESVRNERVYGEVSNRLANMGIFRSAKQCRDKIKKLKLEYRRLKRQGDEYGDFRRSFRWYDALDAILSEDKDNDEQPVTMIHKIRISDMKTDSASTAEILGDYSKSSTISHSPIHSPTENQQDPDFFTIQLGDAGPSSSMSTTSAAFKTSIRDSKWCSWSKREVQALLTLWANPAVQDELLLNVRNNQVYARLSAALESLGFSKTAQKCREKIKKLKQDYKRMKNSQEKDGKQRPRTTVWFSIMDNVLGSRGGAARHLRTTERSVLRQTRPPVLVDSADDTQWLPDEVQILMTLWAQPNIQKQLLDSAAITQVFTYLSNELALVGFNKTPQQCSIKVETLKEEYRKIKGMEPNVEVKSNWFVILEGVLSPNKEASSRVDSSAVTKQTKIQEHEKDPLRTVWTADEVKVLLTQWGEKSIQEQLRSDAMTDIVFAQLSSDLATQGFDKTTSQCKWKINQLKGKYRRIKAQGDPKIQEGGWFSIMDKVLSGGNEEKESRRAAEVRRTTETFLQNSQQGLSDAETVLDHSLSVSTLRLLVPTLRLMCAFAWQVVQCCNVMHYGKVEELLRVGTELAPELLTPREKVQILLRLKARMVLELCRQDSTANLLSLQPHLTAIKELTTNSTCDQKEQEELENSKSNFVEVIHRLLEDAEERRMFFKEVFPVHYGQQFEATLKTLVWRFISRLDNLLPVPDLKQTAEWLGSAPSAMEECGQLVLEPDNLRALLHFHQQQSGITDENISQNQHVFLPRLFLPPRPNKDLSSEEQHFSPGDEDAGQFYCSEDEEAERDQTDVTQTLDIENKDSAVMLEDEQTEDHTTENGANFNNQALQTCYLCSYTDSQVTGLLQHIREAHLIQEVIIPEPIEADAVKAKTKPSSSEMKCKDNVCEYCGKAFNYISTLQSHITTHTMPFKCDRCDKKYASMASLYVHQQNHTGEKPYLCSQCGRGFKTAHNLKVHDRIHTGDRRYKCHICGKTSFQHLARHMRMHRGEKNFLCTECGKAFLSSGELKLHMRYHTGERPHTCKHCGKGFVAKCLLTVHMRRHTGECPYKCPLCPKAFHTLRFQKKHMKIHLDSKSFQCLKCGKIFRQQNTYKKHLQTHEEESLESSDHDFN